MKTITPEKLKKRLDQGDVVLIDVREPAEHRSESIVGAHLIPLSEVSLDKLPSKSNAVVLHCRSGKRSAEACAKLLAEDPNLEIYTLEGGIMAWQNAGFDVKKAAKQTLPLDRQTHLAVGSIALFGTILGVTVAPIFYIFPALIGAGLMFSGITGWCGMTKLLAKMPWNK